MTKEFNVGGIHGWNPGVAPATAVPAPAEHPPGEHIYKGFGSITAG